MSTRNSERQLGDAHCTHIHKRIQGTKIGIFHCGDDAHIKMQINDNVGKCYQRSNALHCIFRTKNTKITNLNMAKNNLIGNCFLVLVNALVDAN